MNVSVEIQDRPLPMNMRLGGMRANAPSWHTISAPWLTPRLGLFIVLMAFLPLQRMRRSAVHRQV